jgi:hypothetical protein
MRTGPTLDLTLFGRAGAQCKGGIIIIIIIITIAGRVSGRNTTTADGAAAPMPRVGIRRIMRMTRRKHSMLMLVVL